jgi:hypothetical protein
MEYGASESHEGFPTFAVMPDAGVVTTTLLYF